MSRSRRALVCTLVATGALAGAAQACGSTHQDDVAAGGTCEQATDCQEGYVCIQQPDGTRQCSNDLTSIVMVPETGTDAPVMMMMDAAPADGMAGQDSTMPVDTGSPAETSTPQDTGAAMDAPGG